MHYSLLLGRENVEFNSLLPVVITKTSSNGQQGGWRGNLSPFRLGKTASVEASP